MFPKDTYNLIDRTFNTTTTGDNDGVTILQAFISDKGDDSQIIDYKNYEKFIAEHGEPNMQLHGQAIYHIAEALESRNAIVKGRRLTAKNAVYANIAVVLDILKGQTQKTDNEGRLIYLDEEGHETLEATSGIRCMVPNATVSLSLKTIKPSNDVLTLRQQLETMYEEDVVAGMYSIPLFLIKSRGKGVFGNGYRFRLTNNLKADKSTTFRNYDIDVTYNDRGTNSMVIPSQSVALYGIAKNRINGKSMNIQDVITDGGYPVQCISSDVMYNRAIVALADVFDNIFESYKPEEIDLINFLNINGAEYKYISFEPNSVDLARQEGISLTNGSDGDFAETNPNRQIAINERYIEFYSGLLDVSVADPREHKFLLLLDAAHPVEVKRAMYDLYMKRKDFALVLDLALLSTEAEAYSALKEMAYDAAHIFTNTQNFATYDKYTGRNITVTTNYLFAKLLPGHIAQAGPQVPFAGIDIPLESYIVSGSLRPVFSDTAKTVIYDDLRANYIHKEAGHLVFGTNITTQIKESELSYFNNVLVQLEMAEDLKTLGSMFRWKFHGTDDDLNALNKLADSKIEKYRDSKCKVAEVVVSKDTSSVNSKRVKCRLRVGFREFILGTDSEFLIDIL